ncbi:MAG: hypothetical protein FWF11_02585 [Coriobacteriia bacterium]|nr:hypothetical protein [Coriobacteriia bacterium]
MSKITSKLKVVGPILILIIPIIFLLALFLDSHFGTNDEEYVPEGEVIYSLTKPEEYGLTGEDTP